MRRRSADVARVSVSRAGADGTLAAARDLYVSASYDDALAMLSGLIDGIPDDGGAPVDRPVSNACACSRSGGVTMRIAH